MSIPKYVFPLGLIILFVNLAFGQKNKQIKKAIEIHDSIVGPLNILKHLDISQYSKEERANLALHKFNSAWFKFSLDHDTMLTFDIVPDEPKNDYDFILYHFDQGKLTPIRSCYSVNFSKYGATGLSIYEIDTFLGAGPGKGYVSAYPVKKGEVYFLVVQYGELYYRIYGEPKAFTIYFHNYWTKKPKPVVLENVLFESNRAVLLAKSFIVLDSLVKYLNTNKSVKIEIRGHTDDKGTEETNQKLSIDRAHTIVEYLISKNIEKARLSSKGFGSRLPKMSNKTEEGRKKNRRVEILIVGE